MKQPKLKLKAKDLTFGHLLDWIDAYIEYSDKHEDADRGKNQHGKIVSGFAATAYGAAKCGWFGETLDENSIAELPAFTVRRVASEATKIYDDSRDAKCDNINLTQTKETLTQGSLDRWFTYRTEGLSSQSRLLHNEFVDSVAGIKTGWIDTGVDFEESIEDYVRGLQPAVVVNMSKACQDLTKAVLYLDPN